MFVPPMFAYMLSISTFALLKDLSLYFSILLMFWYQLNWLPKLMIWNWLPGGIDCMNSFKAYFASSILYPAIEPDRSTMNMKEQGGLSNKTSSISSDIARGLS